MKKITLTQIYNELQEIKKRLPPEEIKSAFKYDKTKDGWTLVETNKPLVMNFKKLELVSFLKDKEESITGEEMRKRAVELKANLGQVEAEWLEEHQDKIPESWRNSYLVLPATLWRDSGGHLRVPYLYWFGERWGLSWRWLENDWYSFVRLVRLCG